MSKLSYCYISLLLLILPVTKLHGQVSNMIEIEKLSINSGQFNEIAAVPVNGGIVFCSDRRVSGVVNNVSFDGDRIFNIFYAERKDSMKWGQPGIFSKDLQTLFNQGPFCFSPDGRQIYYTSDVERGDDAFEQLMAGRNPGLLNTMTLRGIQVTHALALMAATCFFHLTDREAMGDPTCICAGGKMINGLNRRILDLK